MFKINNYRHKNINGEKMDEKKSFNQLKNEVIKGGGYFVYFYFDIHSSNKENMQNLVVAFSGKITNEKGVKFGVAEIEEPIEKDGLYSSAIKVSLLVENFATLLRLTIEYMPIAIDIEEPLDIVMDAGEMQRGLLLVSDSLQQLTNHILLKTMTPEEKKRFEQEIATKIMLGKKIIQKIENERRENDAKKD
jgi:hypothetical protein